MIETFSNAADIIMAAAAAREEASWASSAAAAESTHPAPATSPDDHKDMLSSRTTDGSSIVQATTKTAGDAAANLVSFASSGPPPTTTAAGGAAAATSSQPSRSAASIIAAAQRAAVLAGVTPSSIVGLAGRDLQNHHYRPLLSTSLSAGAMAAAHHHHHHHQDTAADAHTDCSADTDASAARNDGSTLAAQRPFGLPAPSLSLQGRRGPPKKRNAAAAALAMEMEFDVGTKSSSLPSPSRSLHGRSMSSSSGSGSSSAADGAHAAAIAAHAAAAAAAGGGAHAAMATVEPATADTTFTSGDSVSSDDITHNVVRAAQQAAMTEDEKKAERRAANRRSAFQSRQRRKVLIEDLQRTVAALSKDNVELRRLNEDLQQQLEVTMGENRQLQAQIGVSSANSSSRVAAGPGCGLVGEAPTTHGAFHRDSASAIAAATGTAAAAAAKAQQQAQAQAEAQAHAQARALAEAQAAHAAKIAAEQEQQLINARVQLMAAQNRLCELEYEHHHHHPPAIGSPVGAPWGATTSADDALSAPASAIRGHPSPSTSILDRNDFISGAGRASKNGSPSAAAQAHLARLRELQNIRRMLSANKVGNLDESVSPALLSSYLATPIPAISSLAQPLTSPLSDGGAATAMFTAVRPPVDAAPSPAAASSNTLEPAAIATTPLTLSVSTPANAAAAPPPTPNNTPAVNLPVYVSTANAPSSLAEAPGLQLLLESLKAKAAQDQRDEIHADKPTCADPTAVQAEA